MHIEWNKVYYCDCLDPKRGLPSLPDKSIDLCITDPPFKIGLKASSKEIFPKKRKIKPKAIIYEDYRRDYATWCLTWFKELKRICKRVIIYCGGQNLPLWFKIEKPIQILYRISKNTRSYGKITYFRSIFPLICVGNFKQRIIRDVFIYHSKNGFLREKKYLQHPCPLNEHFWFDRISQLKPKSVLDPLIGSGTKAEFCTKLDIPWIGYEMNIIYKKDIETRLKNCVKEPQQIEFMNYIFQ